MAFGPLQIAGLCIVLIIAVLYPVINLLFVSQGVGLELQPINQFPYQCRRLTDPGLEACEDMWLSESTRQLILACSESTSRKEWMPNIQRLNATGRSMQDKLIVLDIDSPQGSSFDYRVLKTPDFAGNNGDGLFNLVGLTGIDRKDHVELYLVNNRPSFDTTTGDLLDNPATGANSTIEYFTVDLAAGEAQHIKTFAHPQIATPNNVAPRDDGTFHFTNDHGLYKVGTGHHTSAFKRRGDVSFCNAEGCRPADHGHSFPNGLARGHDGLLYVPSTFSGNVYVYSVEDDGRLQHAATIKLPYPLDNLAVDARDDIWVPGMPKVDQSLGAFDDPLGPTAPASVFRIRKAAAGDYEVDKMLEDSEGEVLPGATAVVHDVKTGRVFVSGVVSPFITVCEPVGSDASEAGSAESAEHSEL